MLHYTIWQKCFMLGKILNLSQDVLSLLRQKMLEMIQPVYDYLDSEYEWAPEVRDMIAAIE